MVPPARRDAHHAHLEAAARAGGRIEARHLTFRYPNSDVDALHDVSFVVEELKAVLPGVNFENAEWGSYRIDRAEERMRLGARPDSVSVLEEGNVLTVWPTKLVLAPMLAKRVGGMLGGECRREGAYGEHWRSQWHTIVGERTARRAVAPGLGLDEAFRGWERPGVAAFPWERLMEWVADRDVESGVGQRGVGQGRRAA